MTRLLIVEDSPTQAEALRIILDSEGFEVHVAPDGPTALGRLAVETFDAVISDIMMPGMSGYELCRAVKSESRTQDVPVILLTTLSDPMDIIQGLECGADNFITKPYEVSYLVARIKGMLQTKQLRRRESTLLGVDIYFLAKKFTIRSDKEQILDLLVSTFEDIVRTNRELQAREVDLAAAKAKIEDYARQLESRVRVSENKYRNLMAHANDAIITLDERGMVLDVNRCAEQLLARPAVDIVGRAYEDFVVAAERDYVRVQFHKLLQDGQSTIHDLHVARPDGTVVVADLSTSLVETEGDRVALAIVRDVTERNQLHQQLVQNEKLATVGTLAMGIAHEINNPTAVILANMNVLDDYASQVRTMLLERARRPEMSPEELSADAELERSTSEMEEVVRDCTHAGERIRDIVRDLKGFARIDEGELALVNVNDQLELALRMAFNQLRHRARVDKRLAPNLPLIVGSPGKLTQVFLNLIVNAGQAIDEGLVEHNSISISTRFEHGRIRIDVGDTGNGIPPQVVQRIFDPFFTTKPIGVGTGLGLSICHDIVRKHNGEISVESELGRGTTFSVLLPLATGLAVPGQVRRPELAGLPSCRLLVIDDEPTLLRAYQRMIGHRHEVTIAVGGRAAVELLSAGGNYDVILCDLMMPDIDGIDLHRYLAERYPGLERRMVFISGGAFTLRAQEFLAGVANPRLDKPFAVEYLHRALSNVLGIEAN